MTKVVLVPNPNAKLSSRLCIGDPYVPLGLLSVATALQRGNLAVRIVDINRKCPNLDPTECADAILDEKPDVIGFSTQVNEYPRTLQIARLCKQQRPRSRIIFGGPQASTTDVGTLALFPFVDIVVRGECEQSITSLVKAISDDQALDAIPGLTFRRRGRIVRTSEPSFPTVLDDVPLPDYSLVPNIEDFETLPVEVGRGCPFGCIFCSTKDFFKRAFRFRRTRDLLQLMAHLHSRYGIRRFSFEHDNVTVSRTKMRDLCDGLKELGLDASWTCSARVDCLDQELVEKMADAGCRRVFMGIETGSPRMQTAIGKRLDLDKVMPLAESLRHHGIDFTASFMMGFPEETIEDLEMTIRLMTELRFAGNRHEEIQLHMVSAYPGTQLYEQNRANLFFDGCFSDTTIANLSEDMRALVENDPDVFASFHYLGTKHLDRKFLLKVNFLILTLMYFFPYTALAMMQAPGSDYPRKLLDAVHLLPTLDTTWTMASDEVRINTVYLFLRGFLQNVDPDVNAIRDVVEYERTANDLERGLADRNALLIKELGHDVEGWIAKVTNGEIPSFSDLVQSKANRILFLKTDGKLKTMILPTATNPA